MPPARGQGRESASFAKQATCHPRLRGMPRRRGNAHSSRTMQKIARSRCTARDGAKCNVGMRTRGSRASSSEGRCRRTPPETPDSVEVERHRSKRENRSEWASDRIPWSGRGEPVRSRHEGKWILVIDDSRFAFITSAHASEKSHRAKSADTVAFLKKPFAAETMQSLRGHVLDELRPRPPIHGSLRTRSNRRPGRRDTGHPATNSRHSARSASRSRKPSPACSASTARRARPAQLRPSSAGVVQAGIPSMKTA